MTLEELEDLLPNGLHDAELHRFVVDYPSRMLTIDLAVWVGDVDQPRELREAYRDARIRVSGLHFLVSEAPDPKYPFQNSKELTIDGCDVKERLNKDLLEALPADVFVRSLWVSEWNAFMHIAAKDASIEWITEASVRS